MTRQACVGLLAVMVVLVAGCAGLGDLVRVRRTEVAVEPKPVPTAEHLEARSQAADLAQVAVEAVAEHAPGLLEVGWALVGDVAHLLVADVGTPERRVDPRDAEAVRKLAADYARRIGKDRDRVAEWEDDMAARALRPEEVEWSFGSPVLGYLLSAALPAIPLGIALLVAFGKVAFLGKAVRQLVAGIQRVRKDVLPRSSDEEVTDELRKAQDADVADLVTRIKGGR